MYPIIQRFPVYFLQVTHIGFDLHLTKQYRHASITQSHPANIQLQLRVKNLFVVHMHIYVIARIKIHPI